MYGNRKDSGEIKQVYLHRLYKAFTDQLCDNNLYFSRFMYIYYWCHRNSEYDQEILQSQTQTTPWHRGEEPRNHHETPGRQIEQSNQLSLPHQGDCNTRMDIK